MSELRSTYVSKAVPLQTRQSPDKVTYLPKSPTSSSEVMRPWADYADTPTGSQGVATFALGSQGLNSMAAAVVWPSTPQASVGVAGFTKVNSVSSRKNGQSATNGVTALPSNSSISEVTALRSTASIPEAPIVPPPAEASDVGRMLFTQAFAAILEAPLPDIQDNDEEQPVKKGVVEGLKVKNTFIDGWEELGASDDVQNQLALASKTCPIARFNRHERKAKAQVQPAVPQQQAAQPVMQPGSAPSKYFEGGPALPQAMVEAAYGAQTAPYFCATAAAPSTTMPQRRAVPPPPAQPAPVVITSPPPQYTTVSVQPQSPQQVAVVPMPISPNATVATARAAAPQGSTKGAAMVSVLVPDQAAIAPQPIMPLQQRQPQISIGASLHGTGNCKPCAWFWKPQGCANVQNCQHCHLCPEGELKNRKKQKVAALRGAGEEGEGQSEQGPYPPGQMYS